MEVFQSKFNHWLKTDLEFTKSFKKVCKEEDSCNLSCNQAAEKESCIDECRKARVRIEQQIYKKQKNLIWLVEKNCGEEKDEAKCVSEFASNQELVKQEIMEIVK